MKSKLVNLSLIINLYRLDIYCMTWDHVTFLICLSIINNCYKQSRTVKVIFSLFSL